VIVKVLEKIDNSQAGNHWHGGNAMAGQHGLTQNEEEDSSANFR
jgi:hypothetical protein